MRIMLLNQYGAASGAPTGKILGELGQFLAQAGNTVTFVSTTQKYGVSVHGSRIVREAKAHLKMLWQGITAPKVDVVISLTSPGCLPVTATLIGWRHRARHFHWAMDLYPDAGIELDEIRNPLLITLLKSLMRHAYSQAETVVALDQDMSDYLKLHYQTETAIIPPTPPQLTWPEPKPKERCWLYSGNFGRAHEINILLEAQRDLEATRYPATLILQGHGNQFEATQNLARKMKLERVVWRDPVPFDELGASLLAADILVVTRKKEIKGILSPSKLILAELSGRTILWIGDTDGHTARALRAQGHGVFGQNENIAIAAWLKTQFQMPRQTRPSQPVERLRQKVMIDWQNLLEQK